MGLIVSSWEDEESRVPVVLPLVAVVPHHFSSVFLRSEATLIAQAMLVYTTSLGREILEEHVENYSKKNA